MRSPSTSLPNRMLAIPVTMLLLMAGGVSGSADNSTNYVFTQDALDRTLGVLKDLRAKSVPLDLDIGDGNLDAEIANLQKQPKVKRILKKRGLSVREFVLTYKATAQIHAAEKAQDNWQRILQDPDAPPDAKLAATEKLAESLKHNLFTPEQTELVRRRMAELETLLPPPK